MVGNSFTVGVIGRVALLLLKTIGKLPSAWPDVWADESQAWHCLEPEQPQAAAAEPPPGHW
eukprot:8075831-Prorocentrum_lima.AAC.1